MSSTIQTTLLQAYQDIEIQGQPSGYSYYNQLRDEQES